MQAASSDNPVRQALSGLASSIYKATASFQEVDASLPPLWQGLKKLDKGAVQAALRNGADPNEVNAAGGYLWAVLAGCMYLRGGPITAAVVGARRHRVAGSEGLAPSHSAHAVQQQTHHN